MASLRVADVVRLHGDDYLARFGRGVPQGHVRALRAIAHCRTPALGGHFAQCSDCGQPHLRFHSCQHRACPQCGQQATARWLERQQDLLLPVPYFHLVFTLPAELRRVVRTHQRALVSQLFGAAFEALSGLCADRRWLGGQVGALAVLHTWTRTLEWHPHVHMLVPAGGLAPYGRTWLTPPKRRKHFLVPVRPLAARFRGRFLHRARRALPDVSLPETPSRWVVFAKPVVQGNDSVLRYLGRYVHRTALSDKALLACDDDAVRLRYRDSRRNQPKVLTLHPHEFLRRFLQHVPPKGLHRVRAFGLLHPAHRTTLRRLQFLLAQEPPDEAGDARARPRPRCPHCGGCNVVVGPHLTEPQSRKLLERWASATPRAPPRWSRASGVRPAARATSARGHAPVHPKRDLCRASRRGERCEPREARRS